VRVLAVADPGSEVARWEVPADEILDPGEEIVVVATRAGLGELLHLAALPAGSPRTIADLPGQVPDGQHLLPFDPAQAVASVRRGVGRVIGTLPPPIGGRRSAAESPPEPSLDPPAGDVAT
jgi:hypothetical protein